MKVMWRVLKWYEVVGGGGGKKVTSLHSLLLAKVDHVIVIVLSSLHFTLDFILIITSVFPLFQFTHHASFSFLPRLILAFYNSYFMHSALTPSD